MRVVNLIHILIQKKNVHEIPGRIFTKCSFGDNNSGLSMHAGDDLEALII